MGKDGSEPDWPKWLKSLPAKARGELLSQPGTAGQPSLSWHCWVDADREMGYSPTSKFNPLCFTNIQSPAHRRVSTRKAQDPHLYFDIEKEQQQNIVLQTRRGKARSQLRKIMVYRLSIKHRKYKWKRTGSIPALFSSSQHGIFSLRIYPSDG